jgi:hypothetical protein
MISKEFTTSDGKKIVTFDGIFNANEMDYFETFAQKSKYSIMKLSDNFNLVDGRFLSAPFDNNDLKNFGIFETGSTKPLEPFLAGKEIMRAWITCSTHLSEYYAHIDASAGALTVLYYVNTIWNKEWNGETIFYNDNAEPVFVSEFTPGRLVVFESDIRHKAMPVSFRAPAFRFTFSSTFRSIE